MRWCSSSSREPIPEAKTVTLSGASPAVLKKIADNIIDYVAQGGGLYIYGVSAMGAWAPNGQPKP